MRAYQRTPGFCEVQQKYFEKYHSVTPLFVFLHTWLYICFDDECLQYVRSDEENDMLVEERSIDDRNIFDIFDL